MILLKMNFVFGIFHELWQCCKYEELVTHRSLHYRKFLHLFPNQAPLASPSIKLPPQMSNSILLIENPFQECCYHNLRKT